MAGHLIVGASHAVYMAQAAGRVTADWQQARAGALPVDTDGGEDSFHLLLLTGRTQFLQAVPTAGGTVQWLPNEALVQEASRFNRADHRIFFLLGGNEHNARFMTRHARPFDLWHPAVPRLIDGRQVVPAAVVREALAASMAVNAHTLLYLSQVFGQAERFLVAPPPPIGSAAHILAQPEGFDFAATPLEDADLRLKVYELYVEELARIAGVARMRLLAAPAEHRDARGFLAEPYWNCATHAQPAYYEAVYQQAGVRLHAPV